MEIKIKYSVSQAKHSLKLNKDEIDTMKSLEIKQKTPKGDKILKIDGTKDELLAFAKKVKELANRKI